MKKGTSMRVGICEKYEDPVFEKKVQECVTQIFTDAQVVRIPGRGRVKHVEVDVLFVKNDKRGLPEIPAYLSKTPWVLIASKKDVAFDALRKGAVYCVLESEFDVVECRTALKKAGVSAQQSSKNGAAPDWNLSDETIEIPLTKSRKVRVELSDIICLMAKGELTEVFLSTGNRERVVSTRSLSEWESSLNKKVFLRVHRGHIANLMNAISIHEESGLAMVNEQIVPVSKRKWKEVETEFLTFMIKKENAQHSLVSKII